MEKNIEKDRLIEEEQQILDSVVDRMDHVLDKLDQKAKKYVEEGKAIREAGSYDNYFALLLANQGLEDTKENRRKLLQARDELYDTRVELYIDNDKEKTVLQIGDHSFIHRGEMFTISWARPICRPLWGGQMPEEYEFDNYDENGKFAGHVKCRLALRRNISLRITRVKDVVHAFPLSKEEQEELIVDILTQELYDRRSDNTWKSIIKSIQMKQKEIVLSPLKNNMIVQGCAGSGKTMIMLHRLPIVLMDNPNILQRNSLYVITPSKTYIELAQDMTRQLEISDIKMGVLKEYYDYCITKYQKKPSDYGEINPALNLDKTQERYIYSKDCIEDIDRFFESIIIENDIDLDKAKSVLLIKSSKEMGISYSDRIHSVLLDQQSVINENNKILAEYYRRLKGVYLQLNNFVVFIRHRKESIVREIRKEITIEKSKIQVAEKDMEKLNREVNKQAWTNRELIISNANARISEFEQLLLELEVDKEFFDKLNLTAEKITQTLEPLKTLEKEFEQNTVDEIYDVINQIGQIIGVYYSLSWELSLIEDRYTAFAEPLVVVFEKIEDTINILQKNKTQYLKRKDYKKILMVNKRLSEQSEKAVWLAYSMLMKKIGYEPDEKGKVDALYCSPYMYLQILYQYAGVPNGAKESLITIDEAQGMAPEEIKLIKNINGDHLVLNLFGDVKQHIEGTKGIDRWDELADCLQYTLYSMQENYRNASQITEFCNKRIKGLNMKAMNTTGRGVHELEDIDQFVSTVEQQFVDANRTGLAAIIVKTQAEAQYILNAFSAYKNKMNDLTGDEFSVHRTRWNIITVENTKGLEFKSVIVLSGRMTENEKYIAYTRSLDELFVYEKLIDVKDYENLQDDKINRKESMKDDVRRPGDTLQRKNEKARTSIQGGSKVKEYFENCGIQVIDNRKQNGHLWVIGEKTEIEEFVNEAVKRFGIIGMYTKGKESRFKNGWCTKTKK